MLKIITLHTIREIFDTEARCPVSPLAQLCYIRCLTRHFEDLPPSSESAVAFELRWAQMNNPRGNRKYFEELQEAGLVTISDKTVSFPALWHRHIDRTRLDVPDPMELVGSDMKPAADFRDDIMNNQTMRDLIGMRHGIAPDRLPAILDKLVTEFIIEQTAVEKTYLNAQAATRHCINWIGKKLPPASREQIKAAGKNFIGW